MALSFSVTPFLFPPDWSDDVLEHLEWRTDVLTAHDETEQRRSLRTKARRSFEYTLHATADRAPELEGLLFTKQNSRVAVPVWTDRARSTSSIAIDGTVVSVPTTNYAFASSQLVCFYVSATQYEFCRIAFVDSTSLTFDTPMASAWPAGTLIFPAVLAMLPKDAAVTRYTSNTLTCHIELTTSPDITYAFTPTDHPVFAAHNGLEVVLTQPNWRSPISNTFAVKYDIADGGTGAIVQMQTAPLSRRTHQYAWLLKNRAEILAYRNFLGRCKGQFKSFYVPSWHDDMRIVSVAPGNTSVTIEGQDWLGSGLTSVVLYDNLRQREYRNVTLAASGSNTAVTFDTPFTIEIVSLRLLCPTRMLSDKVTLNWKSDGIVEVTNAMITGVGIAGSGDYVNTDLPAEPEVPADPYWNSVVLLMPMETDFADAKGHSFTTVGTPQMNSTNNPAPYGINSGSFGTSDYVRFDDSSDFDFAGQDFTFETWFRPTATDLDTGYHMLYNQRYGDLNGNQIGLRYGRVFIWSNGVTLSQNVGTSFVANGNYYLKVTRQWSGSTFSWRVVVNGVESHTFSSAVTFGNIAAPLVIGGDAAGYEQHFYGRLKDLRVTKGIARLDDTVPSAPHPTAELEVTANLVFPLTYDELDSENLTSLTRSGSGPHITPIGFEGDGSGSKYTLSPMPAWSSLNALSVMASIKPHPQKMRSATRDTVVFIGNMLSESTPKIELAMTQDPSGPNHSALTLFNSTNPGLWLGRPQWKFEFRFPVQYSGINQIRPQGLLFLDSDTLLVSGTYSETESRVYKVRASDAQVLGQFTFGTSTNRHVASFAKRSNGDVWVADYETDRLLQIDVAASLSSGTAVILNTYNMGVTPGVSAIEFVTVSGTEYALVGQYASTGTPYLYVIPASLLGTATFVLTDRYKRFSIGQYVQGMALKGSELFVSRNKYSESVTGGFIQSYNIVSDIPTKVDGASLTYTSTFTAPSYYTEDLKFHPVTGDCWMQIEGSASVGSQEGALSMWSSPLNNSGVENHYSIRLDAVGNIIVKINNRHFETITGGVATSVNALSIGARPSSSPGYTGGYFNGFVRNVALCTSDFSNSDYLAISSGSFESQSLNVSTLSLTNPGAETGNTSGWTNEVGAMGVRATSPSPASGNYYFTGGAVANSLARQRIDVIAQTSVATSVIDAGDAWFKLRWKQSNYDSTADPGSAGIRTLNGSSVEQTLAYSSIAIMPNCAGSGPWYWYNRSLALSANVGCRHVDALLKFERTSGTNSDTYIDDVEFVMFSK